MLIHTKFKINPGLYNPYKPGFKHYYHVHVYKTKEEMWLAGAKLSIYQKDKQGDYGALTIPTWKEKLVKDKWVVAPKIGDVLFYQGLLGTSVVTHEAVHLATSYLRMLDKLKLSESIDDNEELLAYCIGSIASQIVNKCYEFKLY